MKSPQEIALEVRARFEKIYSNEPGSSPSYDDKCWEISGALRDDLIAEGYSARRSPGQYLGMDEDYEPDTLEWEDEDIEAYHGEPRMAHWWVVCEGNIIDICADQYHPSRRQEYLAVITDEWDRLYDPLINPDPDSDQDPSL